MPVNAFGVLLKTQRKKLGMTQEQLAIRVHVSPMSIAMYETGRRYPSADVATGLAKLLYTHDTAGQEAFLKRAHRPRSLAYVVPTVLTPFIGREELLADLMTRLLRRDTHLLTMKGPPGIGKTRLSIELATRLQGTFVDGMYFVPLAAARDPDAVLEAIAQVIHRHSHSAASVTADPTRDESLEQTVVRLLPHGSVLLILDGIDQVNMVALGECLLQLLHERPTLKVLITSRRTLQRRGESVVNVPPLAYPEPTTRTSFAEAMLYSAVQLFVECVQETKPDFTLNDANIHDVLSICATLNGLPLALELAAAQYTLFSLEDVRTRLIYGLHERLLAYRPHGRSQPNTLRTALDGIYTGLQPEAQGLFQRLSLFTDGFSLEDVAAISSDIFAVPAHTPHEAALDQPFATISDACLDTLQTLIGHSLLQRIGTDETRYMMLEVIRVYGYSQLEAQGEATAAHTRIGTHYLAIARSAAQQSDRTQREQWFKRLDRDVANIHAALEWAITTGDIEGAAWLCDALARFWHQRGYWHKGRVWLKVVLDQHASLSVAAYTCLLRHAGTMARRQGDYQEAHALFTRYLTRDDTAHEPLSTAYVLNQLGMIAAHQEHYADAQQYYERSLALWTQCESQTNIAAVQSNLASLALIQGAYDRALQLYALVRTIRSDAGDLKGVGYSLCNMGMAAFHQGHLKVAQQYFVASLSTARDLDDAYLRATSCCNLGFSLLAQGDLHQAAALFRESIPLYQELGDQRGIAYGLEGMAIVTAYRTTERSGRLFGAAGALRKRINAPLPQVDQSLYERLLNQTGLRRDDPSYKAALDIGYVLTLEQTIEEAFADGPSVQ